MYKAFKRIFDFSSALFLLILIFPIFALIMILVKCKIGSPIFFEHERSGMKMRPFYIKKFRTMTEQRDDNGNYLPDSIRLTKFGKKLRSTSLDELPELLAIIKGDMSVIGPRPLPTHYNDLYTEREKKIFLVRGGLIPPEVLYNNIQPTWDEQLEYEAKYAETLSFSNDIKILFAAFKGLFKRYSNNYGEYIRPDLDKERNKNNK